MIGWVGAVDEDDATRTGIVSLKLRSDSRAMCMRRSAKIQVGSHWSGLEHFLYISACGYRSRPLCAGGYACIICRLVVPVHLSQCMKLGFGVYLCCLYLLF